MRHALRVATVAGLGIMLSSVACSSAGQSLTASDPTDDHALQGSISIVYSAVNGAPVIQEVEALIDDQRVGDQSFVPGTDRVFFAVSATYKSAGSHRIAIRVIRQNAASVEYVVGGGISAYRPSAGASSVVSFTFGTAGQIYTLKAGDRVETVVVVP